MQIRQAPAALYPNAWSEITVERRTGAYALAREQGQHAPSPHVIIAVLLTGAAAGRSLVAQRAVALQSMLDEYVGFWKRELVGALGLILPWLTRIRPSLTPLAASGLVGVMLLAVSYNLSHGRWPALALNLVLGSMAVFVAWGRSRGLPIAHGMESRSKARPEARHHDGGRDA